ncbi:TIGR01897 family CRISPR-associated protein [Archaeoglobales archaeon]|nr:MAG: TIGR01897 family CRISPR-associated protein [Archaeoglobales archaeon]
MERVLILPWGNPVGWSEVEYEFNGCKLKSRSTLPILIKVIKPSKTIVIALDTIANSGKSYSEVVNNVRNFCLDFISNELGVKERVDVLVAPGVGEFPNGVFKGRMEDFYSYILFKLSQILPNGDIAIHLDLTHGVNFMPALTYRAVAEIAGIYAICKQVKLTVYNSEPYNKNIKKLSIHVVEDSEVKPRPSLDALTSSKRLLRPLNMNPEEREKLFKHELKCRGQIGYQELNAFLSSVANGLPLVLYSLYPDTTTLENCLKISEEVFMNYIDVSISNGRLLVERKLCFDYDFMACTKVYLTAKVLNLSRKYEVTLAELHGLIKTIFSAKKLKSAISRDLHEIESRTREAIKAGKLKHKSWILLRELVGSKNESSHEEPNLRNFLAHSGLERNITQIKVMILNMDFEKSLRNTIIIRYAPSKIKTAINLASDGI